MWALSEQVQKYEIEGDMYLYNANTGVFYGVNEIGKDIIEVMEQCKCETVDIIERIKNTYQLNDDNDGKLESDVMDFINDMLGEGLIINDQR